jgi:hypothetical protein
VVLQNVTAQNAETCPHSSWQKWTSWCQKNMTVKHAKRQVKPYNDQNHKQQIQPPHVTFALQTGQPINLWPLVFCSFICKFGVQDARDPIATC